LPPGAVVRLEGRFCAGVEIHRAVFSPDDSTILLCDARNTVKRWDARAGRRIHQCRLDGLVGEPLAFSPDGETLVCKGWREMPLHETATGRKVRAFPGSDELTFFAASFTSDGTILASGDKDGMLQLWDVATGKLLRQCQASINGNRLHAVAFTADGKRVAVGGVDCDIYLGETATLQHLSCWKSMFGSVYSLAFSPDGKLLLSGHGDGSLGLWEVRTGKQVGKFPKHKAVDSVAFSPDGKTLAAAGHQGQVFLYEAATGRCIRQCLGHKDYVQSVCFSHDGKCLLSVGSDGKLRLWDASTGKPLVQPSGHLGRVESLAFAPDGKLLASGGSDGTLQLWEVATGKHLCAVAAAESVTAVAFAPDGKRLAAVTSAAELHLCRIEGQQPVRSWREPGDFWNICFSPDGAWLASSSSRKVSRWETATGRPLGGWKLDDEQAPALVFCPGGKEAVSISKSGSLNVWDVASGRPRSQTIQLEGGFDQREEISPLSLSCSADGRTVACYGLPTPVCVWDRTTGTILHSLPGGLPMRFSPTGQMLLSGDEDRKLILWDELTAKPLRSWEVWPRGGSNEVAFSADGRLLATCHSDGTLLIWDVDLLIRGEASPALVGPKDVERQWLALGGEDARQAYLAVLSLAAAPRQSLPFLDGHLQPASADARRVKRLLTELDD
jgi:WD40 repeat protein